MLKCLNHLSYIQPSEGFFEIPGVFYRGGKGTYQLFEKMTPEMDQEQLAEVYEIEKKKGNPYPTDAPLILAICSRAYEIKNENSKEVESLKNFFRQGFRKYPTTLTRIIYNSSGQDEIIHNCGTSDQYSFNENVVGLDGLIADISDKSILKSLLLKSLLGIANIDKINEFSQWINGTDFDIWRLNSKPKQKDERVAGFGAGSVWLGLGCNGDPLDRDPAFRVLEVK